LRGVGRFEWADSGVTESFQFSFKKENRVLFLCTLQKRTRQKATIDFTTIPNNLFSILLSSLRLISLLLSLLVLLWLLKLLSLIWLLVSSHSLWKSRFLSQKSVSNRLSVSISGWATGAPGSL
jgi:hypothetical protein